MRSTLRFASRLLTMVCLLLGLGATTAFAQISFNDFSNVTSLKLNGAAAQATNANNQKVLRLTPDKKTHVSGSAWFATSQQSVTSGFTTSFTFQITHASSQADGLAFVIQNSTGNGFGTSARGGSGGAIGYGVPDPGDNGVAIPDSLAVEFDTFDNTAWDPNNNHVAVQSCGTGSNTQNHNAICMNGNPANLGINSNLGAISLFDGTVHTAVVDYDPGTLRVFIDDLGVPVLVINTDLSTLLSLNNGTAWVGFTGATGALTENNDILTWTFTPGTAPTPITQTLTPSPTPVDTNYLYGSYNHKLQYTGANSGDGVTVTAIPIDQTVFHDMRLAGTPFTNAQCVIYDGTGGLCVEFEVTCTQTSGTDCSTLNYDLFNNFNTSQTIVGAGVLKAPIGMNTWANIIQTFTQTRNDPGTHSGSKGFSDFILVQGATALPSFSNVSPADGSTVLVGQNVTITFSCGTDPNAPLVTLVSCTATLNGNPVTNNSTVVFNQTGTGTLIVTGTDSVQDTNTTTSNFTIGSVPTFTSGASTTFQVGTPGSFTVTTTGSPNATISESGALPSPVILQSNGDGTGTLSGTPAANTGGLYNITLMATNTAGSAQQSFALTVNQAAAITSANSTTFTVGTAGAFTVTATGFPAPTFSETGALPSGVTLSPGGALMGIPLAGTGGAYPITLTAHNGIGTDATQSFTLTVNDAAAITSANNTTFTVGTLGTFTVTATGFPAPTITESGSLPANVTFNNGVLSGTPVAGTGGTYNISFTAHNGIGSDATQTFTLTVNEAAAITSANYTTFAVGTPGTFTVTATGFPAPSISESGMLPNGVMFSGGVLSGTPAAGTGGTYPLTFTATNSSGSTMQSFTLTVNQGVAITSASNTTFTVGAPGTFTVTATGFPAPTISEAGALPNGVMFSGGVLSGTPASGTGGTYNITFTAHNGVGADATQTFTLTVNQAAAITSAGSTTFAVGTPGTFTVTATGFPAPTISESGTLPSGVNFSGGVLSGTPAIGTTGTYNLVFTAHNGIGADSTQNFTLIVSGPMFTVSPTSVNFGTVYLKSFNMKTVTLQNTGTVTLLISSVTLTNPPNDSDEFALVNMCGSSLAVGKSCTIMITFYADDVATDNGTLNIATNASANPVLVPITATVRKKGH
ncbi:MAG: putative Ig domain-containing protein [Acidobacteriia bacterium]|nr:putative Ig domain-containing protein [Terriglobia bacterium]